MSESRSGNNIYSIIWQFGKSLKSLHQFSPVACGILLKDYRTVGSYNRYGENALSKRSELWFYAEQISVCGLLLVPIVISKFY